MKFTRDELKDVIKECLIEILSEGLGTLPLVERSQVKAQQHKKAIKKHDSALDSRVQSRTPTKALVEAVKLESGGNSILTDILADTAATTLQKQMAHSTPSGEAIPNAPLTIEAQAVAENALNDLFGDETVSKWATLMEAKPARPR